MSQKLIENFLFLDFSSIKKQNDKESDTEVYQKFINWARQARGKNPVAFDALTEWILDDSEWNTENLDKNECILMQGVLTRFKEQNAALRIFLKEIEPLGVVNEAVFGALDKFDDALSGKLHDEKLYEAAAKMFTDFTLMKDSGIRKEIAGNKTGPSGTNSVDLFGYINYLKDCDAGVQWALFMPDMVKEQQNGFTVDHFEYRTMPAMRFIGFEGAEYEDINRRVEMMSVLNSMQEHQSGFDYDLFFMHHYGLGVDVGPWHGVWGRFMKADTPVPEGFICFDFVPDDVQGSGPPYYSRFAYAIFSGDMNKMHAQEGFDSDAMYDVTRNIILGEGAGIPYPDKYWTAEVFLNGCDKWSNAYLFSVCKC